MTIYVSRPNKRAIFTIPIPSCSLFHLSLSDSISTKSECCVGEVHNVSGKSERKASFRVGEFEGSAKESRCWRWFWCCNFRVSISRGSLLLSWFTVVLLSPNVFSKVLLKLSSNCSDIKGIMSALQQIKAKAQKDDQKKNEETISRWKTPELYWRSRLSFDVC